MRRSLALRVAPYRLPRSVSGLRWATGVGPATLPARHPVAPAATSSCPRRLPIGIPPSSLQLPRFVRSSPIACRVTRDVGIVYFLLAFAFCCGQCPQHGIDRSVSVGRSSKQVNCFCRLIGDSSSRPCTRTVNEVSFDGSPFKRPKVNTGPTERILNEYSEPMKKI